MPTIPVAIADAPSLHAPGSGPNPDATAAALDQAAALWAARAQAVAGLAAPPEPAGFPDPAAHADALADWRDGLAAAAEDALEGRPQALEAWRAWFGSELARLAPSLEQAGLAATLARAGEALRAELEAARARALAPARPGDAEAASRDARAALEQAVALGVLDEVAAERTAAGLAAQVQAGLAAARVDADPAGFLRALQAGDFPALAREERERLAEQAGLRLALRQAAADRAEAQVAEDARRLPAERGRILLRKAEAGLRAALAEYGPAQMPGGPGLTPAAAQVTAAVPAQGGPVPVSAADPVAAVAKVPDVAQTLAVAQTKAAALMPGAAPATAAARVLDAARELAALPGFASQARDLRRSLDRLPEARARLAETRFDPPAARFAALETFLGQAMGQAADAAEEADGRERGCGEARVTSGQAGGVERGPDSQEKGGVKSAPARPWPGPLAAACREFLDEQAAALAADPAGYVRPEAERRLRAAGLDPATEREALLHAVLDLQAGAGVARPAVLGLAEAATLRQEWRTRDTAGQLALLAALAPFAGFRHRVAAEALGARGPVLLLAAESPALCPAEKQAVLAAAKAPAPAVPGPSGPSSPSGAPGAPRQSADRVIPEATVQTDQPAQPPFGPASVNSAANHLVTYYLGASALASLGASEPQAATALADLARCLAATSGDPEDAAGLLAALAPAALRLWGQAAEPVPEHISATPEPQPAKEAA